MVNIQLYKISMAAAFMNEHPVTTKEELREWLVDNNITQGYTKRIITQAYKRGIFKADTKMLNASTCLYRGENFEEFLKIYQEGAEYYKRLDDIKTEKERSYTEEI